MAATNGVYPVFTNKFEILTDGESTFVTIADMETFSVSFDGNVEEWTPMEQEGWIRRLKTGMGVTIGLNGKRNVGDAGNDYIAGLAIKTGQDAESKLKWTMPDKTVITLPCVINVTNVFGGDSTNVGALEFECLSNGKPDVSTAI